MRILRLITPYDTVIREIREDGMVVLSKANPKRGVEEKIGTLLEAIEICMNHPEWHNRISLVIMERFDDESQPKGIRWEILEKLNER